MLHQKMNGAATHSADWFVTKTGKKHKRKLKPQILNLLHVLDDHNTKPKTTDVHMQNTDTSNNNVNNNNENNNNGNDNEHNNNNNVNNNNIEHNNNNNVNNNNDTTTPTEKSEFEPNYDKYHITPLAQELYIVQWQFKGQIIRCLLDTGSNVTLIDKSFALDKNWKMTKKQIRLCYASSESFGNAYGYLTKCGNLTGGSADIRTRPVVVDLATNEYDMIIGNRDLLRMGICLRNLPSPTKLRTHDDRINKQQFNTTVGTDVQQIYKLSQHLEDLLNQNLAIDFHTKCSLEDATVHLNLSDNIVKHVKSGKRNFVAQQYEDAVTATIQEWINDGVIQELIGSTPINISLLAVKQLDPAGNTKKIRVCLDLRALNTVLTMDNTVLPTIDELLHKVGGHKFYTSLDLKSGYCQLPIAQSDQKYLAFNWKGKSYHFNSAPFGINLLPAKFHKLVARLFADLPNVSVYLDDICIFANTQHAHDTTLATVLQRLNDAHLNLNFKKCSFGQSTIKFLGYKVSAAGIEIDTDRRHRLLEAPMPTTGKKLQSWLATISFLRRHLPHLGELAAPLYDLQKLHTARLDSHPEWHTTGLAAYNACMDLLRSPAILHTPLPDVKMQLETDASEIGYGGSLFQIDPITNEKRYIEFFSGSFKGASKNHSIPRKEMAALINGLKHCKYYLLGRQFTVWTDNMALTHLHTMAPDSIVLQRWFETISQFDFEINHIPGSSNTLPDLLSRWFDETDQQLPDLNNDVSVNNAWQPPYGDETDPTTGKTDDWQLVSEYVLAASTRPHWGPFTIDAFAAKHNRQCQRYIDRHTDFFSVPNLGHEKIWANPPFRLIHQFLSHLIAKQWTAVVVIPYWPDATWFPLWQSMLLDDPIVIHDRRNVFKRFGSQTLGATPWKHTIVARVGPNSSYTLSDNWLHENQYTRPTTPAGPHVCTLRKSSRLQARANLPTPPTPPAHTVLHDIRPLFDTSGILPTDEPIDPAQLGLTQNQNTPLTRDQRKSIVTEYHNYTHTNTLALRRMLRFVGKFHWPDLDQLVDEVDASCFHCETQKTAPTGFHPLKSISALFPGDIWTVDLMFFDKTQTDMDKPCLLHIVDNFSAYSILRVLPNKQAITVAVALNNVMYEHGQPRTMLHDSGTEFSNKLAKKVFDDLRQIHIKQGTPYRAQSQGINERKHGKIKELIRGSLHKFSHDWTHVVPLVMAQINDTITTRHNSTPFAVYYGRASHALPSHPDHLSHLSWHERLALYGAVVTPQLVDTVKKYSEQLAIYFNKRHSNNMVNYKPKDLVKIKTVGQKTSASPLFRGPFEIIERVSGGYNVTIPGSTQIVNMTPVPPEQLARWSRPTAQPVDDQFTWTTDRHEWKTIISHEEREDGNTYYLIRWKTNEETWEPAAIFHDNPTALSKYFAKWRRQHL